jgi:flagellar hook assembly protein FlgD
MLPATSFPRPDWTNVYLADRDGRRLSTGPTLLTGIDASPRTAPSSVAMPVLHAVYPNPLTGSSAIISFTTDDADRTALNVDVFDAAGRQVRSLFRGSTPKGTYLTRFDGNDDAGRPLPSGSYVVRLSTAAGVATQTVAVVR